MSSVQLMMEEHQNILRMSRVMRQACLQILETKELSFDDFGAMIDFIRGYADAHHHGKEEKFMFKEMQEHLGKIGTNLITHGMLVEHDLGRLHMQELLLALESVKAGEGEKLLDVIAHTISYTHLIERHIKKEDELVYPYGEKNLPSEIMLSINRLSTSYEKEAEEKGVQEKYLKVLEDLETKYL